jgi:hypothetical protein
MERTFDWVILKAKLEEFIIESKKNIDSKIQKINSYLLYMKEENDQIISKSKLFYIKLYLFKINSYWILWI